jgi:hypothetical protein
MENEQQKPLLGAAEPQNKDRGVSGAGKKGDYLLGFLIAAIGADVAGWIMTAAFYVNSRGYFDPPEVNAEFEGGLIFNIVHWGGLVLVGLVSFIGMFFPKSRWRYVIRGMFVLPLAALVCLILLFGWCLLVFSQHGY